MDNKTSFKKITPWILGVLVLFFCFSFIGIFARKLLIKEDDLFTSWTYDSSLPLLNTWTSWDSGFYYDIALNGYPLQKDFVSVSEITVPERSWAKVFTGYLELGESRYPLPSGERVSNVVFLIGSPYEAKKISLYSTYPGIPYCTYKGSIDFDRDVLIHRKALDEANACDTVSCERVYMTYYDVAVSQVMYQEYFDKDFFSVPKVTVGSSRPYGFDGSYEGFGCRNLESSAISEVQDKAFEYSFASFPFGFLYPYLAKSVGFIFGDIVFGGLAVSVICTLFSVFFLYLFSREYFGREVSAFATLAYIVFPFFFFNFTFQPISLLSALFFSALYFAKKERLLACGLALFLFSLAGPYYLGFLALIPLFFVVKRRYIHLIICFFSVFSGVCVRFISVYKHTNDFFGLLKSYSPWFGGTSNPISGLLNYVSSLDGFKAFEIAGFGFLLLLGGWLLFGGKEFDSSSDISMDGLNKSVDKSLVTSFLVSFGLIPVFNGGLQGIFKYCFLLAPAFWFLGGAFERSKLLRLVLSFALLVLGIAFFIFWTTSSRFVV